MLIVRNQTADRHHLPDEGPWKAFKENACKLAQNSFPDVLLDGRDALQVALNEGMPLSVRVRFGSSGELIKGIAASIAGQTFL